MVPPGALLASTGEPVIPIIPSSQMTLGAPRTIATAPPVLCETISLSAPGSLPWHALSAPPTVPIDAPLTLVREGAPMMPSRDVPEHG